MRRNSIGLLLFIPLLLWGCKKEEQAQPPSPPKPAQEAQKQQPVQKPVSSARALQASEQQFDFGKMKDPFKPFVAEEPKPAPVSASRRAGDALPIESFDLTRFRVTGIVVGFKESSALIIDPNGKGYVVKPGMSIGNSSGRITKISAAAVEVEEKYVADNGRVRKRKVTLPLPQKK